MFVHDRDTFEERLESLSRLKTNFSHIINKYTDVSLANEGKPSEVIYTKDLGVTNRSELMVIDEGQAKYDFLCRDDIFGHIPSESDRSRCEISVPSVLKGVADTRTRSEAGKNTTDLKRWKFVDGILKNGDEEIYSNENWRAPKVSLPSVSYGLSDTFLKDGESDESESSFDAEDTARDEIDLITLDDADDDQMDMSYVDECLSKRTQVRLSEKSEPRTNRNRFDS